MAEALLELEGLRVEFRGPRGISRVLDGVSLRVAAGERVAVVGETGCGKSLTVLAILGLLPQGARFRGRLRLLGREVPAAEWGRSKRPLPGVAMVFQQPMSSLNPVFTVGDQLRAVARTLPHLRALPAPRLRARLLEVLSAVQLADGDRILRSYPFQLSGGMRQRILIALALLKEPKLLIADEPGTALDVTLQAEILGLLDHLVRTQQLALLHITHNLGVARATTDRVYVMYAGSVVEEAAAEQLFSSPLHPYTAGLMRSVPRLDGSGFGEGIDGTLPSYLEVDLGCRFRQRCTFRDSRCEEKPELSSPSPERRVACHHWELVRAAAALEERV